MSLFSSILNIGGGLYPGEIITGCTLSLNGLISYYKYESDLGSNSYQDYISSYTSYGATASPSYISSGGKFGNCLLFNGTSEGVSSAGANLNSGTDITVFGWFKRTTRGDSTDQVLFSKWIGANGFEMVYREVDSSLVDIDLRISTVNKITSTNVLFPINEWVLLGFKYEGTTLYFYSPNSVPVTQSTSILEFGPAFGPFNIWSTQSFTVGYRINDNTRWYNGKVDEVTFWNRALSNDEINCLLRKTAPLT